MKLATTDVFRLLLPFCGVVASCDAPVDDTPESDVADAGDTTIASDGTAAETESCVAVTCSELGAQCGQQPNGCGGLLDCGGCFFGLCEEEGVCVESPVEVTQRSFPYDARTIIDTVPAPDGGLYVLSNGSWNFQAELRHVSAAGEVSSAFGRDGVITFEGWSPQPPEIKNPMGVAMGGGGDLAVAGTNRVDEVRIALVIPPTGEMRTEFGDGGMTTISGIRAFHGGIWAHRDGYLVRADARVFRLDAYGHIDPSFGLQPGVPAVHNLETLTLADGGAFVTAGAHYDSDAGEVDYIVARYTSDGRLDPTFGDQGITSVHAGPLDWGRLAMLVAVAPDGAILVAGPGRAVQTNVVRLTADGRLDTSFGKEGIARPRFGAVYEPDRFWAEAMVVAGGGAIYLLAEDAVLARLTALGAIDKTLAPDSWSAGRLRLDVSGTYLDELFGAHGMRIDADQRLVIWGAVARDSGPASADYDQGTLLWVSPQ